MAENFGIGHEHAIVNTCGGVSVLMDINEKVNLPISVM